MDADDRMPPDRIERQLAYLDNHPEVDVVGASMAVFGSGLRMWTNPPATTTSARACFGPLA